MVDPGELRGHGERRASVWLELAGELDLCCLANLEVAFRVALGSGRPIVVDLSGVTFLDALCLRELAVQYQLHPDRLVLWRPSPQVELTTVICELGEWVDFCSGQEPPHHSPEGSSTAPVEEGGRRRKGPGKPGVPTGGYAPFLERGDA